MPGGRSWGRKQWRGGPPRRARRRGTATEAAGSPVLRFPRTVLPHEPIGVGFEVGIELRWIGPECRKEETVQAPEIASDAFRLLDLLDAVDRSNLTLAKKLCCLFALDLDHFADEIVVHSKAR